MNFIITHWWLWILLIAASPFLVYLLMVVEEKWFPGYWPEDYSSGMNMVRFIPLCVFMVGIVGVGLIGLRFLVKFVGG